jgi:inosose dehydratase
MSGDTYRGQIERMVTAAAEGGFSGFEPEVVMLGEHRDPGPVSEILAGKGLQLSALTYAADWRASKETEEERAEADRVIKFLRHFPGSRLVLVQLPGPDRVDLPLRQRNALRCINAVGQRAAAVGVAPTVHPNSPPGSAFRSAEDYERLLDGLHGDLGFTPDVGHIAAGGMDPLTIMQCYRERVDHVHFKDIYANGTWAPTGEGVIDFAGIVAYLRDSGYRGWIVLEDESESSRADPDEATRRNGVYVREVLAPLLAQATNHADQEQRV